MITLPYFFNPIEETLRLRDTNDHYVPILLRKKELVLCL